MSLNFTEMCPKGPTDNMLVYKLRSVQIVAITKRDTSFLFKHLIANCGRKHACIYLQYKPRSVFNITDDIIGPETNISLLVTGDLDLFGPRPTARP